MANRDTAQATLQLVLYDRKSILPFLTSREAERKIGEEITLLVSPDLEELEANLHLAALDGAHYALLGVPEDIGARANLRNGGANGAWQAFLQAFLNLQSNQYFGSSRCVLVGNIQVDDLMTEAAKLSPRGDVPVHKLREYCAQIDQRLAPVIEHIVAAGLEPIIIGGGNNNSYPIIKGAVTAYRKQGIIESSDGIAVINCDASAEFRILEGRHSGNAFTHAHSEDYLKSYSVLGLQEAVNPADVLERLELAQFEFVTFEQIFVRNEIGFEEAIKHLAADVYESNSKLGIELDLDAVAGVPSTEVHTAGISIDQAGRFVHLLASNLDCVYFHICDGVPGAVPNGNIIIGQTIANCVLAYMKAREQRKLIEEADEEDAEDQPNGIEDEF